jgi:hypothetical protein
MNSRGFVALATTALVGLLLAPVPAVAGESPAPVPPDNGNVVPWALLIFFGVVGTLIFIAARYRER